MVRAIIDFPAAAGHRERLHFSRPRRIIAAQAHGEVRPALREMDAATSAGDAWAVGFIAYEAAPAFDSALVAHPPDGLLPLAWFALFDAPDAPDAHPPQEPVPPPTAGRPSDQAGPRVPVLDWRTDTPRERYDAAIAGIRDAIAAGDVYQVNHTLRFRASCTHPPQALYDGLAASRHGRYHALIETDEWAVVSASPELFLDIAGRTVRTRPMKGTVRRGRWFDEDLAMARQLAASGKDRAENVMIVDLLRNDLGRVARAGSVRVPSLFDIETYPTVHQMTSTVTAELRDDVTLDDVFAATFPCGSVTGAPKVTAMQTIARLEDEPRGVYCGAVGLVRPGGRATFNVAIRTVALDLRAGDAVYGTGGGITWDSRAASEYEEVAAKAALLTEALPPFRLLETLRLDHGEYARLPRHVRRLDESARYWAFAPNAVLEAIRALDELADESSTGHWRVRMTLAPDGTVEIRRTPLNGPAIGPDAGLPPVAVALSTRPVSRHDRLLFHKTTARHPYDSRRADFDDVFDVLLINEEGQVTEFTNGNLVIDAGGSLLTPAHDCGLLAGTMRAEILATGDVQEDILTPDHVRSARRAWLVNSVRGWVPVTLGTASGRVAG
jgi:para-aminobenzoate synthetase / 4-amino-4-deoxychorismate lyase